MAHRKIFPILVIGLMLGGIHPIIDAQAQSDTGNLPIVAWVGSNQLWVSDASGTARVLVSEDVQAAALSPNRTQIAYHTGENLTVLDVGSGEMIATLSADVFSLNPAIPESAPRFSTPYWVSETTLWFNTIDFYTSAYGYENRHDMQQWIITEDHPTEIASPGAGGVLIPSPDHSKMAVYRPGQYQNLSDPAMIEMVDVATGQVLGEPISFPTVATGSEVDWYPNIMWSKSSDAIGFSIPDPDLLYFAAHELPATQICVMAVAGEIRCQSPIISFPAQPVFQADLSTWAAFQPTSSSWALVVGRIDESLDQMRIVPREDLFPSGNIFIEPIVWLADGQLLARAISDTLSQTQIVNIDVSSGELKAWPNESASGVIINLQSLEDDLYAIAYGDFSRTQMMLYDMKAHSSTEIEIPSNLENVGWVVFAFR